MSVSQVKVHEYLGMTLDSTFSGQVRITMYTYIEDILTSFNKAYPKGKGRKSSAAPKTFCGKRGLQETGSG